MHEAKKQIQQFKDPTDDNVQKLLALSGNKIASEVADMVCNYYIIIILMMEKKRNKLTK